MGPAGRRSRTADEESSGNGAGYADDSSKDDDTPTYDPTTPMTATGPTVPMTMAPTTAGADRDAPAAVAAGRLGRRRGGHGRARRRSRLRRRAATISTGGSVTTDTRGDDGRGEPRQVVKTTVQAAIVRAAIVRAATRAAKKAASTVTATGGGVAVAAIATANVSKVGNSRNPRTVRRRAGGGHRLSRSTRRGLRLLAHARRSPEPRRCLRVGASGPPVRAASRRSHHAARRVRPVATRRTPRCCASIRSMAVRPKRPIAVLASKTSRRCSPIRSCAWRSRTTRPT